jgi:hypothetical protein
LSAASLTPARTVKSPHIPVTKNGYLPQTVKGLLPRSELPFHNKDNPADAGLLLGDCRSTPAIHGHATTGSFKRRADILLVEEIHPH